MGGRALEEPVAVCPGPCACGEDMDAAFLLPQILKIESRLDETSQVHRPSLPLGEKAYLVAEQSGRDLLLMRSKPEMCNIA